MTHDIRNPDGTFTSICNVDFDQCPTCGRTCTPEMLDSCGGLCETCEYEIGCGWRGCGYCRTCKSTDKMTIVLEEGGKLPHWTEEEDEADLQTWMPWIEHRKCFKTRTHDSEDSEEEN
jgi:hypothetical protein